MLPYPCVGPISLQRGVGIYNIWLVIPRNLLEYWPLYCKQNPEDAHQHQRILPKSKLDTPSSALRATKNLNLVYDSESLNHKLQNPNPEHPTHTLSKLTKNCTPAIKAKSMLGRETFTR